MALLDGKKLLITGVLTDASIAFHVARIAQEEGAEVVLTDVGGVSCGVDIRIGTGRAVLFTAELPSNPTLFGRALDQLGTSRGLKLSSDRPGVFATTTIDPEGGRLLHDGGRLPQTRRPFPRAARGRVRSTRSRARCSIAALRRCSGL